MPPCEGGHHMPTCHITLQPSPRGRAPQSMHTHAVFALVFADARAYTRKLALDALAGATDWVRKRQGAAGEPSVQAINAAARGPII